MSLFKLSFSNFKRSVRNYGMLIVSLAFSVFIFFNFQNVLYSDSMDVLMDYKKDYIDMIVKAASVVFAVFLFFFIWYASNVFLNQRKKKSVFTSLWGWIISVSEKCMCWKLYLSGWFPWFREL